MIDLHYFRKMGIETKPNPERRDRYTWFGVEDAEEAAPRPRTMWRWLGPLLALVLGMAFWWFFFWAGTRLWHSDLSAPPPSVRCSSQGARDC
jgi:hypothetical protein